MENVKISRGGVIKELLPSEIKNWKLVNFCEFDKYATKSYCAIHDVDESKNLGDITKVDENELDDFNMMTWGFPCTDISVAGKQKGFIDEDGEKTRSGMYYEGIRILRKKKPALSIIENVKNLTGKRFKNEFEMVLSDLDNAGYNSYYKVLNAKNYGIPQNRERVFIVSIRKDLDNGEFKFPEPFDNGLRLKDLLEDEVDEKFYISDEKTKKFIKNLNTNDSDNVDMGSPKFIGNVNRDDFGTGYAGGVGDDNYVSPTLTTMQGGGRQPHVIIGIDKSYNNPKFIETANCITAREDRGVSNRKSEGTAVLETPNISYCLDSNYYKRTTIEQYMNKHRRQLVIENNKVAIRQATKQGYIECEVGGVADLSYPDSKTRRGRVQDNGNTCPTITATETGICRIESPIRIRKLTPRETFRLMGFSDRDFDAASYNNQIIEISENGDDLKRNVKLKDVIEKLSQKNTEISVSCITSVLQELEETSIEWMKYQEKQEKEKKKNVNIAIEKLEKLGHSECAINIIKCLESTEILYGLMEELDQHHQTAIIELGKTDKRNTGRYMRITLEENLHPMKLYIILMVLELITESKIYTSSVQKVNIQGVIVNLEECKKNMVVMQNLSLKMDIISTRISASQLYKQAGNSIVVDVLYYIYRELYIAMPYLFDDLKLSSFFSGIGAFECGLDRLYKDINSGNFQKSQEE